MNNLSISNGYDNLLRRTNNVTLLSGAILKSETNNFDAASRLNFISDGTNSATYTYLANSPLVSQIVFANNGTTRMTTAKQYDYLNRLTSINSTTNSVAVASFNYAYNNANQRLNVTNMDASYWTWQYDNLGQVTSGVKRWSDNSLVAGEQFGYAFDTIGNRTSAQFGGDQNGNGLLSANYTANLLNQYSQRNIPSAVDFIGAATNTATVSVNNLATTRHGTFYRAELGLNNSTNPVFQFVTNLAVLNRGTNTDIVTNISGNVYLPQNPESFTYDADGNLKTDGRWTYYWDGENRLVALTNISGVPGAAAMGLSFVYDYRSRRVQKLVSTWSGSAYVVQSTNTFAYDGWNLVAELNAANNAIIRSYIWGNDLSGSVQGAGGVGGLLNIANSTSSQFVCYDGNGNVEALTDTTNGTTTAQYEYGPFGELNRATGPIAMADPFRFSTKYQDNETDLLFYGYRYYMASEGRWLSPDPLGEQAFLKCHFRDLGQLRYNIGRKALYPRNLIVQGKPESKVDFMGLWETTFYWTATPCGNGNVTAFIQVGFGGSLIYRNSFVDDGHSGPLSTKPNCPPFYPASNGNFFNDTAGNWVGGTPGLNGLTFEVCRACLSACNCAYGQIIGKRPVLRNQPGYTIVSLGSCYTYTIPGNGDRQDLTAPGGGTFGVSPSRGFTKTMNDNWYGYNALSGGCSYCRKIN